jgi:histidinol-phosphate/aromatic aminotransferase/cobyric acid decarboxylase-like protein/choline kinase
MIDTSTSNTCRAVILAAGVGRRMRPLTETTHKALLEIAGRSLLSGLVEQLTRVGAREVVVVTGHCAEQVTDHLRAHHPGVVFTFVHNDRFAETNNIFSLALAFEQLVRSDDNVGDPVLVVEADLVVEPAVFDRLMAAPHDNVALVDRFHSGLDGTVVSIDGDLVTGVFPSHRQHAGFDFSDKYKTLNIYRFAHAFVVGPLHRLVSYYARSIDANCFCEIIIGVLIALQREPIHAAVLQGERWAEVDDPSDLAAARFVFEPASRAAILHKSQGGWWAHDVVDHAYLRNMYFPTGAMLSELRHQLPALVHNYGSAQAALREKLSWALLVDAAPLRVFNGASEAYPLLARHVAGRRVFIPTPTFGEYPRAFPNAETYDDTGAVDLDGLAARLQPGDFVVFVTPNNPTGTTLGSARLLQLSQQHPDVEFLIDESFLDFTNEPGATAQAKREGVSLSNVIVLKSLSKSWGMPGLRLGFTFARSAAWNDRVDRELPIWNVNAVAERVIELVLKHRTALAQSFAQTIADRQQLRRLLQTVPGVVVGDSGGNFVLAEVGSPVVADRVAQRLLQEHALHVKDASAKLGTGALRIAVRTPVENAALVERLAAIFGEEAVKAAADH